MCGSV
jgi:hypothetical protein